MFDEYPRPQMERSEWLNLCGRWEYAVTPSLTAPAAWDGTILVPFSPEAPLSGVKRVLQPGEYLWYRRTVRFPEGDGRVLVHFGAVDQIASVRVNGREMGSHYGGYTPFTVDVTDALRRGGGEDELTVVVRDDSDASPLAHGKQKRERGGIWYTPQSGIWQPVWAERVPETYIERLRITPRYDDAAVEIDAIPGGTVHFRGADYPCPAVVPVPDFEPWSPEHPKLYAFTVTLGADEVKSYFAMRKFGVADGKLTLNGKPYFHNGVLDQGYHPDGLMTYPSDEDMRRDIETAKAMGFNTLRKHMKIEPMRWYWHCDRLGMLVWQDMPSGGGPYSRILMHTPLFADLQVRDDRYRIFGRGDTLGRRRFLDEMREMVEALYNCPCIAVWSPFNEGWGQFDAVRARELIDGLDGSRTVEHASGWYDQGGGDVKSEHVYFRKYKYVPDENGRAVVLSEFGGCNLRIPHHAWNDEDFGYNRCRSKEELEKKLRALYRKQIAPAKEAGLAAAIYTQLTDVEDELNGLMTYDRQVLKLLPETVKNIVSI